MPPAGVVIVLILTAFVVVATLLPLSRSEIWWVRGWDFPRLQVAALAVLNAGAVALMLDRDSPWRWAAAGANVACALYQVARILPYTRLTRREVKPARAPEPSRRLRILSANVLISNRETDRLLQLVREFRPDILVALETDRRWEQALDVLLPEYPHAIRQTQDNGYGLLVYSSLPLEDVRVEFLVEPSVPSAHATVVLRSGDRVRAHFLHPSPPSPTENERSTERDAELILVAKLVAKETLPVVVTGDLNDVAWSTTTRLFRKVSRLLDPRIGRGLYNTFHAGWCFVRWPLDHIFHGREFTLVELRRLPKIGSDHFPILVDLALEPHRGDNEHSPQLGSSDRELAQAKLAQAGKAG